MSGETAGQEGVDRRATHDDRPLGALFTDLAAQTGALVREEVALAKAELTHTARQAGTALGALVIGGVVAYSGFLAVLSAVILLLARVLPDWVAALLVGIIVVGIGAVLITWGRRALAHTSVVPRQTLTTLAGDLEVVKGDRP